MQKKAIDFIFRIIVISAITIGAFFCIAVATYVFLGDNPGRLAMSADSLDIFATHLAMLGIAFVILSLPTSTNFFTTSKSLLRKFGLYCGAILPCWYFLFGKAFLQRVLEKGPSAGVFMIVILVNTLVLVQVSYLLSLAIAGKEKDKESVCEAQGRVILLGGFLFFLVFSLVKSNLYIVSVPDFFQPAPIFLNRYLVTATYLAVGFFLRRYNRHTTKPVT